MDGFWDFRVRNLIRIDFRIAIGSVGKGGFQKGLG
jgi:hypothetical protein